MTLEQTPGVFSARRCAPGFPEIPQPLIVPSGQTAFATHRGRITDLESVQAQIHGLKERLPDGRYVFNLCEDRHLFCLGFAAALLKGQITLLPPDRSVWTLQHIAGQFPGAHVLADYDFTPPSGLGLFRLDRAVPEPSGRACSLDIPPDRTAAIAFTSGSTGKPRPHPKTWRAFCESARLIGDVLALRPGSTIVATVPPQHMYGLELSVLLPLRSGAVLDCRKPFFPIDVQEALAAVAAPRVLVTTPVHIRALNAAGIELPPLDLIVSATAPLLKSLADETERRYRTHLIEIYGCTEAGSIASRRTVLEEDWTLFQGLRLVETEEAHQVEAPYLPGPVLLNDIIEIRGEGRFILHGRMADLVNIAGKRTSLGALNHILIGLDGIVDGAFFLPAEQVGRTARLLAFAVAPGLDAVTILGRLRQRLDPVFLPRTVYLVDALPRSESGKLPRQVLENLAASLRGPGGTAESPAR